jgi:hypothetical protein
MLALAMNVLKTTTTTYVDQVQCMFINQLPEDISKFNLTKLIFKQGKTESRGQGNIKRKEILIKLM